jgi:Flp pilus assembly protein TadG
MRPVARGESGLADSVAWALLVPVVLTLIFAMISAGLWFHARMSVSTACALAADRASTLYGDTTDAEATARDIAAKAGVTDVEVTIIRTGDEVTVAMSGRAALPLDLGWGHVAAESRRPIERLTRP